MYKDKRVLAICPARGGSKTIPKKNIQPLLDTSLVGHVGNVVKQVEEIDLAIVSTDSDEIAEAAITHGLKFLGPRPDALSGDRVADLPVLAHELQVAEEKSGRPFDVILMLQPTSPLRQPGHIRSVITALVDGNRDAAWTVSPTDSKHHPLKQLTIDEENRLGYYDKQGSQIIARQQLTQLYHRNGVAYAFSRACLLETKTILTQNTEAIVIDTPQISIDTWEDFELCEFYLTKQNHNTNNEG